MGCCSTKENKSELNTSLVDSNVVKDEKTIKKSTKKLVSLDLLQTAASSGWMRYKIMGEMGDFKEGFCALVDGTLQIYTREVNGVVYPNDLIDIISLRGGSVILTDIDKFKNCIVLNKHIIFDVDSPEDKKNWLKDFQQEIEILNIESKINTTPSLMEEVNQSELTIRQMAARYYFQKYDSIYHLSFEILVNKHYLVGIRGAQVNRSHERHIRLAHNTKTNNYFIIWYHPNHNHISNIKVFDDFDINEDDEEEPEPNFASHSQTQHQQNDSESISDSETNPSETHTEDTNSESHHSIKSSNTTKKTKLKLYSDIEKYIPITSIIEVKEGFNDSKTFKKFESNEKMNLLCFSIVANDKRSIMKGNKDEYSEKNNKQKLKPNKRKYYDFECENQSVRDVWIANLRNLILVSSLLNQKYLKVTTA